jgi:multicomponent Na+:H+ antiporter subunit D
MKLLPVLPIILPLATAAVSLFFKSRRIQRRLGALGMAALLGTALLLLRMVWREGILVVQVGSWPAPFGISLVVDLFSAIMLVMAALMGLAIAVYSLADIDAPRESSGYHPLLHFLLMGVCGVFLAGDVFNLYVWFEVMLVASFALMAMGGGREQLRGSIVYVLLSLVSSVLFLSAVGILYGATGTLNMAHLVGRLAAAPPYIVTTLAILFLAAFGIKSALFPLFFWLPASYHTPPVPVSALFAGLLTKVGIYALIRVFTLLFTQDVAFTHSLILVISGLTMVTGVLGAMAQNEFRRILSFHIISQVGYMIMGLGLFTHLALAGSIFYIIHHIIVKTNLFLVSGVAFRLRGSFELKELGGLYRTAPGLSVVFLIAAFSLAGVPPLSGFWGKLILIKAGFDSQDYLIAATALFVGFLTLFSMTKIWGKAFWGDPPSGVEPGLKSRPTRSALRNYYLPMAALALLTVGIGLLVEPTFLLSSRAAEQLLDPSIYVRAVLGEGP